MTFALLKYLNQKLLESYVKKVHLVKIMIVTNITHCTNHVQRSHAPICTFVAVERENETTI